MCNPAKAKAVLEADINAGYFLPCKIVVYEDNDSVFIGMPKPTALIGMINNDGLVSVAEEVEAQLKTAINQSI